LRLEEVHRLNTEQLQQRDEELRQCDEERQDLKKSASGLRQELTRTKWQGHSNRSQMERQERAFLRREAALEQKSVEMEIREQDMVRQEADAAERSKELDDRIGKRWKLYETIASLKAELDEARALVSKSIDSEVERAQKSKIGLLEDEVDRLLLVTDELSDRLRDANHASGERAVSLRDVEPTEEGYPGRVQLCHMKLLSRGMSAAMVKDCVQTVNDCYAEFEIRNAQLPSPSAAARWRMGSRRLSRVGAARDTDKMKETIFLSDMTTKGGNKVNSAHIMSPPGKDGLPQIPIFPLS
jgi:hypothetical protein